MKSNNNFVHSLCGTPRLPQRNSARTGINSFLAEERGLTRRGTQMRKFLFYFSFFIINSSFAFAQQDKGFTNKAEAKNQMVNGKKEGKWIEYETLYGLYTSSTDTNALYYCLTIYKAGKPFGKARQYNIKNGKLIFIKSFKDNEHYVVNYYYANGKLKSELPYYNNEVNGMGKGYYEDGKLKSETLFSNDSIKTIKHFDENGNEVK
jgi:antitoxin component YwqK of YwqJK toxin-antitoxin module